MAWEQRGFTRQITQWRAVAWAAGLDCRRQPAPNQQRAWLNSAVSCLTFPPCLADLVLQRGAMFVCISPVSTSGWLSLRSGRVARVAKLGCRQTS